MKHMEMKISQPIFGILVVSTKNKFTKILMSRALVFEKFVRSYREPKVEQK